jgi:glutamyl-tRNA reductase
MNLLVVGASHHTADLALLEKLAVPPAGLPGTLEQLLQCEHVTEAVALSTCNRVEIYAGVAGFHGGLADISTVLAGRAGVGPARLAAHLYVRWDAEAVGHALRVAAGLDSMVVGEAQILGQLRAAYTAATEADAAGRLLHELMQHALRVGKRAHSETGIGAAGRSVVSAVLDLAEGHLPASHLPAGPAPGASLDPVGPSVTGLAGKGALVIGAGAMGALALSRLARAGAGPLFVANRGAEKAARLAETYGARAVEFSELTTILPLVDVVLSATASVGPVLDARSVEPAVAARRAGTPLVICDLAVPRDVAPEVADLPGVVVIDTDRLAAGVPAPAAAAVAAAEQIVAEESAAVSGHLNDIRVAPTVAALRSRADEVVAAELSRLAARRPDLTEEQRAEVRRTVHRLVRRLLHQPTVRVRQLAAGPDGATYAAVLAELFDLKVPQPERADQIPSLFSDQPETAQPETAQFDERPAGGGT